MSIPPTASRLLRWQDRHPVLTDSAMALFLLVFTLIEIGRASCRERV